MDLKSSIYGDYYDIHHIHVCTDKGGDSQRYKVKAVQVLFTRSPVCPLITDTSHNGHTHSTGFCGQSGVHTWNPSPASHTWAYRGNNQFKGSTLQQFPQGVQLNCLTIVQDFDSNSSFFDGETSDLPLLVEERFE